jgi:hypothetical protein
VHRRRAFVQADQAEAAGAAPGASHPASEADPVVDDRQGQLGGGAADTDDGAGRGRVLGDVLQRLLHDPIEVRREVVGDAAGPRRRPVHVDGHAGAGRPSRREHGDGVAQSYLDWWRPQAMGDRVEAGVERRGDADGAIQMIAEGRRRRTGAQGVQVQAKCGEMLAALIVEIAGQPAALLLARHRHHIEGYRHKTASYPRCGLPSVRWTTQSTGRGARRGPASPGSQRRGSLGPGDQNHRARPGERQLDPGGRLGYRDRQRRLGVGGVLRRERDRPGAGHLIGRPWRRQ